MEGLFSLVQNLFGTVKVSLTLRHFKDHMRYKGNLRLISEITNLKE
jgi:hypothetical protein